MSFINLRTKDMNEGAIRALADKARNMTDVISMGIGEPDMHTPKGVCEACKRALDLGYTHYTHNAGIREVRQAVAALSSVKNVGYDPDREIIITNGGMGGLSLMMSTVIDPGDEVLIQDPQWLNYVAQVKYYGGVPVRVPTDAEHRFEMQADVVESLITPKTKFIIINSPNNPTGYIMRPEAMKALADVAIRHNLLVVTDEVYNTLVYDGAECRTIAELPGMKERTMVVNSMSKSYAMTGWRIGYAAGPAEIVEKMTRCQEYFNSCPNAAAQYATIYALEHPELSDELLEIFTRRRELTMNRLKNIEGIECGVAEGTFYTFPGVKSFGLTDTEFCNMLLDDQRVICIPGSAFGECGAGHIRIAYTTNEERLTEAFDRMERFCDKLRKGTLGK